MQEHSNLEFHKSSVSLSKSAIRRLRATQIILLRNNAPFSEQALFSHLLRLYLRRWRGHGKKAATLRRYNIDGRNYEIRPLYVNQLLYAAIWQRAIHSGVSISRMLNFAIHRLSRRLIEEILSSQNIQPRNKDFWKRLYHNRVPKLRPAIINYVCKTKENSYGCLEYVQSLRIRPHRPPPG